MLFLFSAILGMLVMPWVSYAEHFSSQDGSTNLHGKQHSKTNKISAWDDFFPPADEKYDWIQLDSREWLKGELKSLYNFTLEFDSDNLGLHSFDWEDVLQLYTAHPRSIRIESSRHGWNPPTMTGRIEMRDDVLVVISGSNRQGYRREQVVSIGNTAEHELDYWSGKASLGANLRSGNSELIDINLMSNARRLTANNRIVFNYVGSFSKAQGVSTANNHRFNGHYDGFKSSRLFWRVINVEYTRDKLKNIEHQVMVGTAFGYDAIRTSKTEWNLAGGIGISYKRYISVADDKDPVENSPAVRFGSLYDTSITRNIDFLIDFSMQFMDKASGTYTHHFLSTLSSDLIADLDLDITFIWDFVKDPRPDAEGITSRNNDFQLILGISYEF